MWPRGEANARNMLAHVAPLSLFEILLVLFQVFRRYIFALLVSQATITGVFLLKGATYQAYGMVCVMIFTYFKFRSVRKKFDGARTHSLPLEVATIMDHQNANGPSNSSNWINNDKNRYAYIQPALRATLVAQPEQPFDPNDLDYGSVSKKDANSKYSHENLVQVDPTTMPDSAVCEQFWDRKKSEGFGRRIGETMLSGDISFDTDTKKSEKDLLRVISGRDLL